MRTSPNIADVNAALGAVGTKVTEHVFLKQGWTLAFPADAVHKFCGDRQAMVTCMKARQSLQTSLEGFENTNSALDRSPIVFATAGCTGIGKSRFGDEIAKFLFPEMQARTLKVTYNNAGLSSFDTEYPEEAFMWRIVAAASGRLPGLACVPSFLDVVKVNNWSITRTFLLHYLESTLPMDQPWILVLDEFVKAPPISEPILSVCSWFVRLSVLEPQQNHELLKGAVQDLPAMSKLKITENVRRGVQWRCTLITSLDFATLGPLSLSGRRPIFFPQYLLDGASSIAFVEQLLLPTEQLTLKHLACIRIAGGHPRSLIVAMELLRKDDRVPTPIAVANAAQLPDLADKDLYYIIERSYELISLAQIEGDALLKHFFKIGTLLFSPVEDFELVDSSVNKGWISVPTVIIARTVSEATKEPYVSFERMLKHSASNSEKQLEVISVHSDISRAAMHMGVVPPKLVVINPGPYDWSTLKFDFDPTSPIDTRTVIDTHWNIQFDPRCCNSFYYPSTLNHTAFESMFPAKFPNGTRVLVLRQDKINADVPKAIYGLNDAAKALQAKWTGLFLFIVTAMEANKPTSIQNSNHPLLLITANNTREYYSPSFSTLADVEFLVHLHSKGAREIPHHVVSGSCQTSLLPPTS